MGHSLVKLYVHIVFSTKHRNPMITDDIKDELFRYLGGICKELECPPLMVGGYRDHIHILCQLSKKITLISLVEKVKANSSKWIKTKGEQFNKFYWQNGYGAFSVNPTEVEIVRKYIANQEEHHQKKKKSFQGEYLAFLKKYNVEFDEKYLWD